MYQQGGESYARAKKSLVHKNIALNPDVGPAGCRYEYLRSAQVFVVV